MISGGSKWQKKKCTMELNKHKTTLCVGKLGSAGSQVAVVVERENDGWLARGRSAAAVWQRHYLQ